MKKNLKKVISAVLALTLAMSSFVALTTTSAATFADVADTANYAEAVNALAALGAISGYDDGTFLPNNNITRAEVTTMIVAALNMTEDAKNSGSTSKFADVNANASWAAGYVNVGVAKGFISGMSDTEFAPSENVTYAQVLTMLTRLLGYGDYAVGKGGYPDGYLAAASSAGILTGVAAATNDALTRAQVARLIWNAVQAPLLDTTTFTGVAAENAMQKMDGSTASRPFKSLLSENFNAYVMDVEVADTAKTVSPAGSLQNDEVSLNFIKKTDWNPDETAFVVVGTDTAKANVGKTDIAEYVFSSGKTVIEYNEDGEWTVIYFAPTSKIETVAVKGALISATNTAFANSGANVLAIKKAKNTENNPTKYNISDSAKVYVNGVLYDTLDGTNEADIETVIGNADADVVLYEDTTATSGTWYNKIMVELYAYATVSQVQVKGEDVTVRFSTVPSYGATLANAVTQPAKMAILGEKVADGDINVTVTKNDAASDLASLAKDDVVAIKGDIMQAFENGKTIEIIATDAKVVGKFTGYDDVEDVYTVAGEEYEASDAASLSLSTAKSYTFKLDPFGKLFEAEEDATSTIYAIVEKYVASDSSANNGEYGYMQVVTMDGQKKTLYIDEDYDLATGGAKSVLTGMHIEETVTATRTIVRDAVDANGDLDTDLTDIDSAGDSGVYLQDRIISYTIRNSTGRVNKVAKYTVTDMPTSVKYNEAASTFGKRIASDAVVLNAEDYANSNFTASSISALEASIDYDVILVHKTNGAYKNVIITRAGTEYGTASDFVVAATDASLISSTTNEDGDTIYTLRVTGGEGVEVLKIADDAVVNATSFVNKKYSDATDNGYAKIKRGTAFFYGTDENGYVDRLDVIFEGDLDRGDFEELYTAAAYVPVDGTAIVAADWSTSMTAAMSGDEEIRVFVAPVVAATSTAVTFGKLDTTGSTYFIETEGANTETFAVTADSKIFGLDLSTTAYTDYNAFTVGGFNGIDVSKAEDDATGSACFTATGSTLTTEYDFAGLFQMALVMTVNGVVTNALVVNN